MSKDLHYRLSYSECRRVLVERLQEPAPARIQLLTGPRQVGKTTLLLEIAKAEGRQAIYLAADGPEAALPGSWERLWVLAEQVAREAGRCVVLIDEAHLLHDWAARLKGEWDRLHRRGLRVHVVATGSSALKLAAGSRESLAGRFERLTLAHWSASSIAAEFKVDPAEAARMYVLFGSYPGAFALRNDTARWSAYVRDAIVEPAIGRDILALGSVRKPALLRQVFAVCAASPAQIVSLQKIQGRLQDQGALETIAHYLALLEEAYLVAVLPKHAARETRRRSAPPKIVTLNNALLAVSDPAGPPDPGREPARFGAWVENACLAHAWNAGQRVGYWREEPLEVDGVVDGSWGSWAIEVSIGPIDRAKLRGLLELTRRYRDRRPLVITEVPERGAMDRYGVEAISWREFLLNGPPAADRTGRSTR